ncbi:50S ribosomal protein L24 [Candidatus Parcubacteria bacterium]|nr:MAG: 50S ribosomal protein L24 [Candidatus Parcubacteria bacterium]
MKIKKGDKVKVLTGKDRGKVGSVIRVFPRERKVIVEDVNVHNKRVRPKRSHEKGEIVAVPRPIDSSNVALMCGSCGSASRVGYRYEGEKKVRHCKKCGAPIE